MYLLKIEHNIDVGEYHVIDICFSSDKESLEKFIEQIKFYIQYKKKDLILPEWKINQVEINNICNELRQHLTTLDYMKKLNLISLKENILEKEIIVGQLKLMLKKLQDEQYKHIKQKQKEISSNTFPTYVQKFYTKHIKQKRIYRLEFKIVEVVSFESFLGDLN